MSVAFDAATESAEWTTTPDPFTFSHTPSGTPRGVLVFVVQAGNASDQITGITYGGTAMSRVVIATDSAAETGVSYAYFLGASVPTGTQTVSIDHTAGSGTKWAVCVTLTAGADTEVKDFEVIEGDATNPQVALDTGAAVAQRYTALFSGLNLPSSAAIISGMTAVHEDDFGNQIGRVDRETSTSSGSTTVGYTAAAEDTALVGVAIGEVAGGTITLAADSASFTISATAASLKFNRRLVANSGSIAISGTNAALKYNRLLVAASASISVASQDASLRYHRRFSAESATFTISGTDAAFRRLRRLVAEAATYAISGSPVTFIAPAADIPIDGWWVFKSRRRT